MGKFIIRLDRKYIIGGNNKVQNGIQNISKFISDIYELTPMQEGMLYHNLLDNKASKYIIQNVFNINGIIDEKYIQDSLRLLTQRHDVLRTAIMHEKSEKPLQVILKNREIEYQRIDLSSLSIDEKSEQIRKLTREEVERGFDLQQDSLVRIILIRYDNISSKVIWTMHHIIVDGWCLPILFGDFIRYYEMLRSGKTEEAIEEAVEKEKKEIGKYSEYITWLEKQNKGLALDYWREELNGYEGFADIEPIEEIADTDETVRVMEFQLNKKATERLQKYAIKNKITMNIIAETTWGIVLQWYNGTDDVVFGKVVSGRNADVLGIDKIVGLFINTVPCRVNSRRGMSVNELLKEMQCKSNEGINYSYTSLTDIQEETEQRHDLIKTLFAYENYYISEESQKNLTSIEMESAREETNYGMNITTFISGSHLCMRVTYNPKKYSIRDIDILYKRIVRVLEQIAEQPNALIEELEIATEEERRLILGEFNDTKAEYPKDKTVVELFEEQVERTPENIALVYEDEEVTYRELNAKANQLARRLRELGVGPDDFVAVIAERSIEMIVGIYGVIKAGGAYVPIDPTYPNERIRYMLEDCRPKAILLYGAEIETEIPVIDLASSQVFTGVAENPERINKPEDLVYCIYTSGTTGNPKGVLIQNRALNNYLQYARINYLDEKINIPFFTNYSFDLTGTSLFLSILFGGKLEVILDEVSADPEKILRTTGYTFMKMTPLHLKMCVGAKEKVHMNGLKSIIVGGENFKSSIAFDILENYGEHIEIHNEYGPTEATIGCCDYVYSQSDKDLYVPIGRPISNTQIYIMNGDRLCGIGIPGELCIAGDGLARGYLNQPELTAKKFVKNPFGEGQMYRSGDLARWMVDGNLECLGRIDEQVKIRGFRVELGEIESKLREIEGIKDTAVIVREDGNGEKAIYGYVVSDNPFSVNEIREQLSKTLPNYMMPTYLTQIEKLPITRNGKLDKRALPEIEAKSGKEYVEPQDEAEATLCRAFEEVLGIDKVSVKDNFFDLGGHSLRAIKLEVKLQRLYKNVTIRDIYKYPTVERLAHYILTGDTVKI